jgi:hypothetical protein
MSRQARHADWLQTNERARRLSPDAFVTYDETHAPALRWGAWERYELALGGGKTDDSMLATTREADALYCRAATAEELLLKFAFMKQEQRNGRVPPVTVFRDRAGAGFGNREPDEPVEWKAYRARWAAHRAVAIEQGAAHARETGERTREQVRASVRNFMAINKWAPRTDELRLLGIGRKAWK